jgi:metal-responsive CopG/Arc/MetJ family transcriptional regulator
MRLPKELYEKVDQLRRQTAELKTQTAAFEQLIREGLEAHGTTEKGKHA